MAEEAEPSLIGFTKRYLPVFSDDPRRKVFYPIAQEQEEPPQLRKPASGLSDEMERAIANLPSPVGTLIREIALDPTTSYGIKEAMRRWAEFGSPEKAILVGAYLDQPSRRRMTELLDREWAESRANIVIPPAVVWEEVIIGSGLHAAIYSAVRATMGFAKPLVLEARDRVGGSFALGAGGASFYLNSRNRPGPLSIPGERGALNVIPGSLIQPSDLGGEEYQTNEVMAWAIRNTLAMHATVVPSAKVRAIKQIGGILEVGLEDGAKIRARRAIVATGIGLPRNSTLLENGRIICFDKFMQMLGDPFPLRGMRRVAVLGGGDGGKTAIEALTGQGPNAMSVASVDWPEIIDWYGAPWTDCADCTTRARIRYKRMASLLPDPQRPLRPYRVRPMPVAEAISAGFQVVYVNQMPYDYLIDCTGYVPNTLLPAEGESPPLAVVNEIRVGTRLDEEIYVIGPAANLVVGDNEKEVLRNIDENKTSMFRYAPRTAALAASLN